MLTSIAVVLVGIWMIIASQGVPSSILTLLFGIISAGLALVDLIYAHRGLLVRRAP